MTVLGVSGNSRILGLAIIKDQVLIDFKTQLHKDRWTPHKAKRMIAALHTCITDHSITHVALTIPHVHYTSPETHAFLAAVCAHCRKAKIPLSTYDSASLHRVCEASKATKKTLMTTMATRYPELTEYLEKELRNKQEHFHKLFEAVAAATLLVTDQLLG